MAKSARIIYAEALKESGEARRLIASYRSGPPADSRGKAMEELAIWNAVKAWNRHEILAIGNHTLKAAAKFLDHALSVGSGNPDPYEARSLTLSFETLGCDMAPIWRLLDSNKIKVTTRALSHAQDTTDKQVFRDQQLKLWVERFNSTLTTYLDAVGACPAIKPEDFEPVAEETKPSDSADFMTQLLQGLGG